MDYEKLTTSCERKRCELHVRRANFSIDYGSTLALHVTFRFDLSTALGDGGAIDASAPPAAEAKRAGDADDRPSDKK